MPPAARMRSWGGFLGSITGRSAVRTHQTVAGPNYEVVESRTVLAIEDEAPRLLGHDEVQLVDVEEGLDVRPHGGEV